MKWCSRCRRELPHDVAHFGSSLKAPCRECRARLARERRQANPGRHKEATRRYREANPEKVAAALARWRSDNREALEQYHRRYRLQKRDWLNQRQLARYPADPEKFREAHKKWLASNANHIRDYKRRYNTKNRERVHAWLRTRKARRAGAAGRHSGAGILRQLELQGGLCFYCGEPLGEDRHVDHFIPLARGGSNGPENIVLACASCNMRKHTKMPWEFMPDKYPAPDTIEVDDV